MLCFFEKMKLAVTESLIARLWEFGGELNGAKTGLLKNGGPLILLSTLVPQLRSWWMMSLFK